MEELHQLATIVKTRGQRSLQLVNQNFRKKETSKDNLLYLLMMKNKITSEEKAARLLLRTKPDNRNFRNAKLKLRQKLMNHLFFLDYDRINNTQFEKIRYDCTLKLVQYVILISEGLSGMTLKRLPQLIKTAIDYDLVEIALEGLLLMRNEYSKMGKSVPQAESELQLKNFSLLHKEIIDCETLFYDTLVFVNKSQNSCAKIRETLPERINRIEKSAERTGNRRIEILAKKLAIHYYGICNKNKKILEVCHCLEEKYIPGDISKIVVDINPAQLAEIKLQALYRMNDKEAFQNYCKQRINLFRPGSRKWMTFMEYGFLLLIRSGDFDQAIEILKNVKNSPGYKCLEPDIRYRWQIYRSYLCFFSECKMVQRGFKANKIDQQDWEYARQHDGYAIANLIIALMFNLRKGDISRVKAGVEKLNKFSSVHLDKRHNYRNSIFIRMLQIMVEKNFDFDRTNERNCVYYHKLLGTPASADLHDELEVVPYSKLWESITNILRTNGNYVYYRFYHHSDV